ncbi:hypothetical protein HNR06_002526 [Nocardiopsis arvandica]|uniref:Uncharacterized protein n=1 Tax=Nocardiopsis sinuspersici TaxID=501010 RepID=A0A7Z0BKX6_9ACTN|nr:hypothetical protein [Nocardiopsis sinuspersici]NYH52937.1 hypothetical protein [Nocardiopsis sinuspersici]
MTRFVGFLIGAGFGLAFVLANSGPPLDPTAALVLRVLAVAALLAVIALVVALGRRSSGPVPDSGSAAESAQEGPGMRFGPFYGVVVALEAVLLFGGIQVLRALDAPVQANVAWIALTVGLHFLPLAWYWRTRSILGAAVYLTVLGAVGLAMAFTGHADWVPLVSGVASGVGILTGILVSLVLMNKAAGASADVSPARPS